MVEHVGRPTRVTPLAGQSVLGGVYAAPADGEDPRYVAPLDTDNWMSQAIVARSAANLQIEFKTFIDNWMLSGYSVEQLTTCITEYVSNADGKI